jgi:CheY-like chemotaxis protein
MYARGINETKRAVLRELVVLIADGQSYSRSIMRTIITQLGVKSACDVNNGDAALEAIVTFEPSVMILDWNIPGLDAREIVRMVRGSRTLPNSALPIIAISNSGKASVVNEALALGVNYFLVKPISPRLLEERFLGAVFKSRKRALADNFKPVPVDTSNESAPSQSEIS